MLTNQKLYNYVPQCHLIALCKTNVKDRRIYLIKSTVCFSNSFSHAFDQNYFLMLCVGYVLEKKHQTLGQK